MSKVLILRPQPGADGTAARAIALGLQPVVAPLFTARAVPWSPPTNQVDAVLFTSANAARLGGEALKGVRHLPTYAVGEATADAARGAGFESITTGPSDGEAVLALMARDGVKIAFHPCGAYRMPLREDAVRLISTPVYTTDAAVSLPERARDALHSSALVLLHSPRAASVFASLVDDRSSVRIAAISPATAAAAGSGWASVHAAPHPRDSALLELAAKLCQEGPRAEHKAG